MGSVLSSILAPARSLVSGLTVLKDLVHQFDAMDARFNTDPGLPVPTPTHPFWLDDPPFPALTDVQSDTLPEQVDVVIVGSGIAGVSVAKALLDASTSGADQPVPTVAVLEARALCSGATGRNGGHIKASPHDMMRILVDKAGLPGERAAALVRFQLAHLDVLLGLCEADPALGKTAECRRVETVDLFVDEGAFTAAKYGVALVHKWIPEFRMTVWPAAEARQRFDTGPHVIGAVSYKAGALWPYRLVTGLWQRLCAEHSGLSIDTHTPVTQVVVDAADESDGTDTTHPYRVVTPRGTVRARHVVHATNAHASHLLPRLRRTVTGARAHMSAQVPGSRFPDKSGSRSWSVIYGAGFDYISQRPLRLDDNGRLKPGEVMAGGGFARSAGHALDQLGVYDDAATDLYTTIHLHGMLPSIFGPAWGASAGASASKSANNGMPPSAFGPAWGASAGGSRSASAGASASASGSADTDATRIGHVKALWSGIIGFTGDLLPLVGRLDASLTERLPVNQETHDTPGEWIAAAFQGDGMVWAWLSGTALGVMLAGRDAEDLPAVPGRPAGRVVDWLPRELLPTPARISKNDISNVANLVL